MLSYDVTDSCRDVCVCYVSYCGNNNWAGHPEVPVLNIAFALYVDSVCILCTPCMHDHCAREKEKKRVSNRQYIAIGGS